MAKFENLQNLDLEKIKIPALRNAIKELLDDYQAEDNKKLFLKTAKTSIEKLYTMVESTSPEAIKAVVGEEEEADDDEPAMQDKNESKRSGNEQKEKSKKVMADLDEINEEIEGCRQVIREYNKKKREGKAPPKKKTRLAKLKDKVLGIVALIPDKLKDEKNIRDKTEKILLRTLNDLKKTWGMNVIKKAEEAIKEKFDQLDEKLG